ncbi:FecCD family ABC transporter permease [Gorillibacterium sp. sgz5001074]|uniref:FecCD family ABC transporter permease n=1 Tax=Gorillibacterium sp. sgz5001074 TaxID=3446695 RepID=UPI003F66B77C
MPRQVVLRRKGWSYLFSARMLAMLGLLLVLVAAALVLSVGIGSVRIHPMQVIQVLTGQGDATATMIVTKLRMPRVLIALLVGASLAVSGAILQGLIRNPLASPDNVGMTEGASLGAVVFLVLFANKVSIHLLPLVAMVCAFLATGVIYLLAWKKGSGVKPLRLVLIGIGMSAAFKSVSYMLMIATPNYYVGLKSMTFMTGSIYGASWERDVLPLLPWVAILLPVTLLQARHMNALQLGEEVATGVGSRVQRKQLVLIVLSVALAGAAVAIGGAIGFIGLMAPHIARKLVGPGFGGMVGVSACIGALILLAADLVARTLLAPLDLPAGIFTAAIGAPFFIYLLYRHRNT